MTRSRIQRSSYFARWRKLLRFDLRFTLAAFVVLSLCISGYLYTQPVSIAVPKVMDFDEQAGMPISEVLEYRAFWVADSVRENAKQREAEFKAKYPALSGDEYPPEVLKARKEKLIGIFDRASSREVTSFLDWLEQHFELEQKLSKGTVIESDIRSYSTLAEYDSLDLHQFRIACIHAAGFGRIIDPENWGIDGRLFAEIAKLSGGVLQVETHDLVNGRLVRLLIGGRVYEFEMSDDWSWYDNRPACDVLNAILKHRKIDERFFVFDRAYGNSYVNFVMFAKPEKARAFVEQFEGFDVVPGCEKLWSQSNAN